MTDVREPPPDGGQQDEPDNGPPVITFYGIVTLRPAAVRNAE